MVKVNDDVQQKLVARETELAVDKALLEADQQQPLREAELTRQAKSVLLVLFQALLALRRYQRNTVEWMDRISEQT